jgi:hypothetical protein
MADRDVTLGAQRGDAAGGAAGGASSRSGAMRDSMDRTI